MVSTRPHDQTSSPLPTHLDRFFRKTLRGSLDRLEAIFSDHCSRIAPGDRCTLQSLLLYGRVILNSRRNLPGNTPDDAATSALFSRCIALREKATIAEEPTTFLEILRIRYLLAYVSDNIGSFETVEPIINDFKKQNGCWAASGSKAGKQTRPPRISQSGIPVAAR